MWQNKGIKVEDNSKSKFYEDILAQVILLRNMQNFILPTYD